jgi:hypothetical protein
MIQVTAQMRILACVAPVDFRKGIDGLCRACRKELETDPFSGAVFVFCNRQRTAMRLLVYDGQGFWLCHKRLSSGRFRWLDGAASPKLKTLAAHELQLLLWSGNLKALDVPPPWRAVTPRGPVPAGP